jgi:hypothetical protein
MASSGIETATFRFVAQCLNHSLLGKDGVMGEKQPVNLACNSHKSATWDRRIFFPSEGRHAVDFSPEKSEGFDQI